MYLDSRGYAYRSVRTGNKVRRCYVASGPVAPILVEADKEKRQSEAEARTRLRAKEQQADVLEQTVTEVCRICEEYLRAVLQASGYRQHARGQWRKTRQSTMNQLATQAQGSAQIVPLTTNEAETLMAKAQKGDIDAAREFFRRVEPGKLAKVLPMVAPMMEKAEKAMIETMGKDAMTRAGYEKQLELLKAELAGPFPSPLEKMLVDRVALCWLQVIYYESFMCLTSQGSQALQEQVMKVQGKRLESAHRRHLQAVKALAQIRQMKLPAVQVNIGAQQLNVAG